MDINTSTNMTQVALFDEGRNSANSVILCIQYNNILSINPSINQTPLIHRESKKRDTKLLSISSPHIDRFSKFFHWYSQQKICNKASLQSPPYLKDIATLPCEILFFKNVPTESTATADQVCTRRTKENVIAVDKLVLSQQDQPQIHHLIHQIAQSGVVRIMFFHRDYGLKCFKIPYVC